MFLGESDRGGCQILSNESVTQITGITVCKWQFVIYHCHANDALLILPHYQCSRANRVACRHVCGALYKVQVRAGAILAFNTWTAIKKQNRTFYCLGEWLLQHCFLTMN